MSRNPLYARHNNSYQYITIFTLIFSINISTLFNYTFSTSFFHATLIFFAFLFSFDLITSIFVNELIIDSTVQETRLLNASNANAEIELKRAFNYYTKLRSIKDFSMNLLIGFAVLFSCDLIVIKAILTLLVKAFFTNFHESKLYKKALIDAQHKINWQLDINDEITVKAWICECNNIA